MTTTTTESIGTTARTRSSIAAWEAILPANLVTSDVQHIGEVYNDSELTATAEVIFISHVTDATRDIILRTATGEGFKDHADVATNALRYDATLGAAHRKTNDYGIVLDIRSSCDYMSVEGLQFGHSGSYPEQCVYLAGDHNFLRRCIVKGDSNRGQISLDGDAVAVNCLVYSLGKSDADGITLGYSSSGNSRAAYNTVLTPNDLGNGSDGVKEDYGTSNESSGNASFGWGTNTAFTGTFNGSSDYNCSEDGDAPGSNSLVSKAYADQFENISLSTLDARLKTGSDCLAAGADHALTDGVDILGNVRHATTPNIGCWEAAAVAAVDVDLVTETDSALSIQPAKSYAVGLASESDSALSITPVLIHIIGTATETDSSLAVSPVKRALAGIAAEADSALSITAAKAYDVGLATETDSALLITPVKAASVGLATETDASLSIQPSKSYTIGITLETDSAQIITHARAVQVGLALETDTAFSVIPSVVAAVGQAIETNSAFSLSYARKFNVGIVSETNSAFSIQPLKTYDVGLAAELDSALPVNASSAVDVGIAIETDIALDITAVKSYGVGMAIEIDSAFTPTVQKISTIGLVTETNAAFTLTSAKRQIIGQVLENDSAFAIGVAKAVILGIATETNSAFALAPINLMEDIDYTDVVISSNTMKVTVESYTLKTFVTSQTNKTTVE